METKKKPKKKDASKVNITTTSQPIPEGCFVWEGRLVDVDGLIKRCFIVINADGIVLSSEWDTGQLFNLEFLFELNKNNILFSKEGLKELGFRYGFKKNEN